MDLLDIKQSNIYIIGDPDGEERKEKTYLKK